MECKDCDLRDWFKVGQKWLAIPSGLYIHRGSEVRTVISVARNEVEFQTSGMRRSFDVRGSYLIVECRRGFFSIKFHGGFKYEYKRVDEQKILF